MQTTQAPAQPEAVPGLVDRMLFGRQLYLAFFALAAILLSPVWLEARILIANTDVLFSHYPNLFYGLRALRQGDLGLWNPYIFGGIDFTGSMHHHFLNPVNWLLALFPESWMTHVASLKVLIEFGFIGLFAFKSFLAVGQSRLNAFCLALIFELSGFVWFTTTTYIAVNALMAACAAIYLIITLQQRHPLANIVALSGCLSAICFIGHIAYIAAFVLPVAGTFFVTRVGRRWRPFDVPTLTVAAAGVLALGISAYRILPVLQTLRSGVVFAGVSQTRFGIPSNPARGDAAYMALTSWAPGIFGASMWDGFHTLKPLGLPGNLQFHVLTHFGVLPSLLVAIGALACFGRRVLALSLLYVVVSLGFITGSMPVWDAFNAALPFYHDIMSKVAAAALFVAALSAIFLRFSRRDRALSPGSVRIALAVACVMAGLILLIWMKLLPGLTLGVFEGHLTAILLSLRIGFIATLCAAVWAVKRRNFDDRFVARLNTGAWIAFFGVTVAAVAYGTWGGWLWNAWLGLQTVVYSVALVVFTVFILRWLRKAMAGGGVNSNGKALWIALGCAVFLLVVPVPENHGERLMVVMLFSVVLAFARFVVLSAASVEVLHYISTRGFRRVAPFVLAFAAVDLLFAAKLFQNTGAVGFLTTEAAYPKIAARANTVTLSQPKAQAAQNLLASPAFEKSPDAPNPWVLGGRVMASEPSKEQAKSLLVHAKEPGTLFQDVPLAQQPADAVTFGAWVRTTGKDVGILLTADPDVGIPFASVSPKHPGDGKWLWLTATAAGRGRLKKVRPHVTFDSPSYADVFGPVLVAGAGAEPAGLPGGAVPPASATAPEPDAALDFAAYRINYPGGYMGLPEQMTNLPMVYGIRTYGGVNSDVSEPLWQFLTAFQPAEHAWINRGGIAITVTNQRLLDLFGVRYDYSSGHLAVRQNALPRLGLFTSYRVVPDRTRQIEILKDPAFNPAEEVLISDPPDWTPPAIMKTQPVEPVAFVSRSNSRLTAQLALKQPAVLLFDDSYAPGWHARWNGIEPPVSLANGNFMAVALSPGQGTLELEFRPQPFLTVVKVSSAFALLWGALLVASIGQSRAEARRRGERAHAACS